MASYKQFEDLPVWQDAIRLAVEVFALTAHEAFKFRGDLVNQIRRSALSVSNNIAEGFERGTPSDLINFLYIARGSCGETRSMLRFAPHLGGFEADADEIDKVALRCEAISRQIYGWIDALRDTDIKGQRAYDRKARREYAESRAREGFAERFNYEEQDKAAAENRMGEYAAAMLQAEHEIRMAGEAAVAKREAPKCPVCGGEMVRRSSKDGKLFWGCRGYPDCKGSRNI